MDPGHWAIWRGAGRSHDLGGPFSVCVCVGGEVVPSLCLLITVSPLFLYEYSVGPSSASSASLPQSLSGLVPDLPSVLHTG